MQLVVEILIGLVAFLHLYFLYFEMFTWESSGPKLVGRKPKEFFQDTKVMAANQGLYNGFLAAGLIWSFFIQNAEWQLNIRFFFLGCVALAGIYGAATASKKILYVQALPALVALVFLFITRQ